jgi:hypothetical protein
MELKTKNRITILSLALLAFGIYLYALPPEVIEAIGNALKRMINGG